MLAHLAKNGVSRSWGRDKKELTKRTRYYCHQIIDGQVQISNRNVLPNAVKNFFNDRQFCTYEYEELSQDTEETMFQLVQRGVALTPAEKMRAMSTEWAVFARQYEEDYELIVNCKCCPPLTK
jgi:hypothetical protein